MNETRVLYDHQAFEMQRFGGISRYFAELMRRDPSCSCPVRYSENTYLKELPEFLGRILEPDYHLNRFLGGVRFRGKRRLFKLYSALSTKDIVGSNEDAALSALLGQEFDVFHPTYYDTYFLDALGAKPFVLTVHDMIHEKFPEKFSLYETVIKRKRLLVERASRIIAVSECTKRDLCELYPVDPGKVRVIYHGSSLRVGCAPSFALPERYILYTGARRGYKNFYFFMQSIAELLQESEDLYLVCSGPPLAKDELCFLDSLGVTGKIVCASVEEDQLAYLYKHAACFVFPSYYEGFGIPILESFEAGCPAIVANASCFPEVAGDAAIYFDPKSLSEIKSAVAEVLGHKTLAREMVKKGKDRLKEYSWDKASERTKACYKELV